MQADELHRRVEPVGVLALIGAVEGVSHRLDRVGIQFAVRQQNLHVVLLVLIAELAEALEPDTRDVDVFRGKLRRHHVGQLRAQLRR